jgi:hypothetical protein
VCGNGKCEPPYETCSNCPQDCGACQVKGCLQVVTCALGCVQLGGMGPPMFSASCVANCVAQGCAKVQFFVDQVLNCAIQNIGQCRGKGGVFNCIMQVCGPELSACLGSTC